MDFKELKEVGWGIWQYKGDKWVAVEEEELMNTVTGEVETVERGVEDER